MFKQSILAAALIVLGSASAALPKSDTSFLTDAIQINLAEIAVGDLAQKNGGGDDVKAFGKMLVEDHTASNEKATSLAKANGVTPPNEPKPADKKAQEDLAKLSGEEFDREFAKAMVKGHKEAIGKFEAASKGDDDVAKFAQETLPTLQKHLEQAQLIAGKQTASEDVQRNAAQRDEAATASEKMSKARSTEMIGTLPAETLPISDYYNQSVYDNRDSKIGDVNDLLVDKNGKIDAVIMGVGGLLGVGEKNVAVPFSALKVAEKSGSRYLVLETTKEALQSAPGYTYDRSKKVWVPATKQG
jgi:putative membrane protein